MTATSSRPSPGRVLTATAAATAFALAGGLWIDIALANSPGLAHSAATSRSTGTAQAGSTGDAVASSAHVPWPAVAIALVGALVALIALRAVLLRRRAASRQER